MVENTIKVNLCWWHPYQCSFTCM